MNYEKVIRIGMAKAGIKTIKELSERTDIAAANISRILSGKTKAPAHKTINTLAITFNVPVYKFYAWGEM